MDRTICCTYDNPHTDNREHWIGGSVVWSISKEVKELAARWCPTMGEWRDNQIYGDLRALPTNYMGREFFVVQDYSSDKYSSCEEKLCSVCELPFFGNVTRKICRICYENNCI